MNNDYHEPTILAPPSPPRRWVTFLLCTIIFLAGAIVGSGITVWLRLEDWPRPARTFEQRRDRLTDRIAGKLDLNTEQTETLRTIIGERLENLEKIREKILPEMQTEAETLNRELSAVLTEKQKQQWNELYATLFKKWFRAPNDQEKKKGGDDQGTESQPTTQPQ